MSNNEINAYAADDVIDLRHYFAIVNRFKWRILFMAFLVSILAGVVTHNMTPIYSSSATLLIEANQAKAVSFEEIVRLDSKRSEYYLTQFEIIKSQELAREVVHLLNLKEHPDFMPKESFIGNLIKKLPFIPEKPETFLTAEEILEDEEFKTQALIRTFSRRLSIEPVRLTQLVKISYESPDSKLTALVANAVGDAYINNNLRAKMGINKEASGWLSTRLSELQIRLQNSEEKLQTYREKENLIDVEGVVGLVSGELKQTSEQLVVARNEKNKLESIMRVINEYGRNNIKMLESLPEITSHNVIQDIKRTLVQAELKVSELSNVYGPKHPKIISARSELATVELNFSDQVKRLVIGIEKALNTNKRNVVALEKELVRIRGDFQSVNRKSNEYRQLNRDVQTNRHIYDTFLSRLKETEVTSDFNSAVARFTDRAVYSNKPIKPKKNIIILLAFIATIGLGIVYTFIYDSLNDTIKSAEDIESKLTMRMLGILPLVNIKKGDFTPYVFFDKKYQKFAESMRTIRTSFALTQLEKENQVIAVTSTVPAEGKTTVSINLSLSLGQLKKSILIDADMRKPSICKRFNIPAYHPGLANLIIGTDQFEECIYHDKQAGIDIMPCGQLPTNPLELLSSKRFLSVLATLKQNYANVIIDTAPINAVSDALIVAQHTDTVIHVVKNDSTRLSQIQDSLKRLLDTKAKIAGVVLNQVDIKKSHINDYSGYYDSYSYSLNDDSNPKEKS